MLFKNNNKSFNLLILSLISLLIISLVYLCKIFLNNESSNLIVKYYTALSCIYACTNGTCELLYKTHTKILVQSLILIRCSVFLCTSILLFQILNLNYINIWNFISVLIIPFILLFYDEFKYIKSNNYKLLLLSKLVGVLFSIFILILNNKLYVEIINIELQIIVIGQIASFIYLKSFANLKSFKININFNLKDNLNYLKVFTYQFSNFTIANLIILLLSNTKNFEFSLAVIYILSRIDFFIKAAIQSYFNQSFIKNHNINIFLIAEKIYVLHITLILYSIFFIAIIYNLDYFDRNFKLIFLIFAASPITYLNIYSNEFYISKGLFSLISRTSLFYLTLLSCSFYLVTYDSLFIKYTAVIYFIEYLLFIYKFNNYLSKK